MMRIVVAGVVALCLIVVVTAQSQDLSEKQRGGQGTSPINSTRREFSGRVEKVDVERNIMSVKGKGGTANFDVSEPILYGYRSLLEISTADVVGISYVESGIRIRRIQNGKISSTEVLYGGKTSRHPLSANLQSVPQFLPRTSSSRKLQRQPSTESLGSFEKADVNKDGRLSPVELTAVMKDLTMEEFKQYDKNRNAFVDKKEFADAVKDQRKKEKPSATQQE
jgi:hypothetical protein